MRGCGLTSASPRDVFGRAGIAIEVENVSESSRGGAWGRLTSMLGVCGTYVEFILASVRSVNAEGCEAAAPNVVSRRKLHLRSLYFPLLCCMCLQVFVRHAV